MDPLRLDGRVGRTDSGSGDDNQMLTADKEKDKIKNKSPRFSIQQHPVPLLCYLPFCPAIWQPSALLLLIPKKNLNINPSKN